jgi:hypothetical protein
MLFELGSLFRGDDPFQRLTCSLHEKRQDVAHYEDLGEPCSSYEEGMVA